jgi:hypothetical protein
MKNLQEYMEDVGQNNQFLDQHQALLQSLILSKQNASTNVYTEGTNGVSDGNQQPSQGIDQPSGQ